MTQMDAQKSEETPRSMSWMDRSPYQSSSQVAAVAFTSEEAEASSSKGAATATNEMMELEIYPGGGTKSTSLSKRVC